MKVPEVAADLDESLVRRLLSSGDSAAFGRLYERHTTYLYRFALRLTAGNEPEAEDLVHDTWLRGVERLGEFEWRSDLRTWLAGILLNFARTRFRQSARHVALEEFDGLPDAGPITGEVDRVDLMRALAELHPDPRMVLLLHDVEGYTHEEIGTMLGIATGTSKSQLFRARAAMRRSLDGTPDGTHD